MFTVSKESLVGLHGRIGASISLAKLAQDIYFKKNDPLELALAISAFTSELLALGGEHSNAFNVGIAGANAVNQAILVYVKLNKGTLQGTDVLKVGEHILSMLVSARFKGGPVPTKLLVTLLGVSTLSAYGDTDRKSVV